MISLKLFFLISLTWTCIFYLVLSNYFKFYIKELENELNDLTKLNYTLLEDIKRKHNAEH